MKKIEGGVCAAKGFRAAGIHCGIRKNHAKKDLALIISDCPAKAAAIYTKNLVKGAPIAVTKAHLQNGIAQAVIANSGNANTCNANGIDIAEGMCRLVQQEAGILAENVIVASTGVIGQPLSLAPVEKGMKKLVQQLSQKGEDAAEAIMTTDTVKKQAAVSFSLHGKEIKLGGMAKGSGMIHPNMATMLVFLTTDAAISSELLQKAIGQDADDSFHMLSIDGDTSTNDMLCILANGRAENPEIQEEGADFDLFCQALHAVTSALCRMMAADGEGASRLLICQVQGAETKETARTVAKTVVCSNLVKAAIFGADANWGRVLCAIGYSGAPVAVEKIEMAFASPAGRIVVCQNGVGIAFSEETAKQILLEKEITIEIDLHSGAKEAVAWGCDLTYDYVKINGDYRT